MKIDDLINVLASITLFEMMVVIGLGVTLADVLGVARSGRALGKAILANYVCVPAVAIGLLLLYRAEPLVAAGFLIATVCPGAPYGPPFTGMAPGNVVLAVGLMVILAGSSALIAPLLLKFLLPLTSGGDQLQIDTLKIVRTLLIAQFLPLCVGLGLRQWRPALADRLKEPGGLLSLILNLATLGLGALGGSLSCPSLSGVSSPSRYMPPNCVGNEERKASASLAVGVMTQYQALLFRLCD